MKKKWLAATLAAVMVLGVAACGQQEVNNNKEETKQSSEAGTSETVASTPTEAEDTGITFPLEEEVTFTLAYKNAGDLEPEILEKCEFWQELYERTNVKIELVKLPATDTMTKLNAMFMSGQEPDGIFSDFMTDTNINELVSADLLMPLTEYVNDPEIMPNFHERILSESPSTKGVITYPDGEIYALPRYDGMESNYLESPMYINKTWVEKAGWKVEDIKTIDDLETVLTYFAENDMNGNGKDDEIPFIVLQGQAKNHFESFMGLYGIATKDGSYENYVYVEDGKVIFAPTSDAYKDAILKLNDWYDKELIWEEAFTATYETWLAKYNSEVPVIGLYTNTFRTFPTADQYVALAPVEVEGYEPSWYVHPGLKGVKGMFVATKSCENADILVKWMDQLYDLDNAWRWSYGEEADGRYTVENGMYKVNNEISSDPLKLEELSKTAPQVKWLINFATFGFTAADYNEGRIAISDAQQDAQETYDLYRPYLNDEIWPRPYLTNEVSTKLSELRTDIFSVINEKKAAWITGKADIEKDWDEYCATLEQIGIDEFVSLMQSAYDTYMAGQQ
ncbi:MAG: extracellular solute-binding protein [Lachnospiraceae bacterium]|nr:extracellular solute-binding protein [Lachnospiraceae bacterium]